MVLSDHRTTVYRDRSHGAQICQSVAKSIDAGDPCPVDPIAVAVSTVATAVGGRVRVVEAAVALLRVAAARPVLLRHHHHYQGGSSADSLAPTVLDIDVDIVTRATVRAQIDTGISTVVVIRSIIRILLTLTLYLDRSCHVCVSDTTTPRRVHQPSAGEKSKQFRQQPQQQHKIYHHYGSHV